jgi:hypothetical protein
MAFQCKAILCAWRLSTPCHGLAHLQTSLTTAVCHECCSVLFVTCRRWLGSWFSCMLVACAEVKHAWVSPESSIVLLVSQVIARFSIKSYWRILYINPSCANSHVGSFYHNELSMSLPFLVRRLCPPWTVLEPAMACVAFVLCLQSTALWNSPRTCSNFYDSMHFNRRGLPGFVVMKSVHIT